MSKKTVQSKQREAGRQQKEKRDKKMKDEEEQCGEMKAMFTGEDMLINDRRVRTYLT